MEKQAKLLEKAYLTGRKKISMTSGIGYSARILTVYGNGLCLSNPPLFVS